jgi:hypothetical protein
MQDNGLHAGRGWGQQRQDQVSDERVPQID